MDVEIHIKLLPLMQNTPGSVCLIYESAQARGTGIAKRSPEYVAEKINAGKAVIALDGEKLVGFAYIETFSHQRFVANSGLIVHPDYRNMGLAKKIKRKIFDLSRKLFPNAKIFSITTGLAVMKMNTNWVSSRLPSPSLPTMKSSGRDVRVVATSTSFNATTTRCASVPDSYTIRPRKRLQPVRSLKRSSSRSSRKKRLTNCTRNKLKA